jgi:hypothetical protein
VALEGCLCGPGRDQPDPGLLGAGDRLNRRGARQHTIAVDRLRDDPLTRAYAQRRTAQGKNPREIKRCRKRIIARQLYKLLERYDQPTVEITHAT